MKQVQTQKEAVAHPPALKTNTAVTKAAASVRQGEALVLSKSVNNLKPIDCTAKLVFKPVKGILTY